MARDLITLKKKGRALVELHTQKGRQILRRIPEPVQIGLGHVSRRSLVVTLEIFAGLFVIGSVVLALAYGRLNHGPVSLSGLVPVMEDAINRELSDLEVQIDDAIIKRAETGAGVHFRLRNIRLIDKQGAVVAQAPLAAIGLSGRALLSGRIAPGSVDFIGPRLLLFHTDEGGLSLTFSRETAANAPRSQPAASAQQEGADDAPAAANRSGGPVREPGMPIFGSHKNINLTRTITAAFDRARQRKTASSYLTRFGVRDAIVIFDQDGKQSFWQVPGFSIDLEHGRKSSVILGQGAISSDSGPWNLNFRTEQSVKREQLTFTGMIENLVPHGLAGNFPGYPIFEALNLPVSGKTSLHLSTSGDLIGAEAEVDLSAGQIVVPWDRKHPMRIDKGNLHVRYKAGKERIDILPSRLEWGQSHATISGSFQPSREDKEVWTFDLKADDAVLAAEEFGLSPTRVQEWQASGTVHEETGRVMLQRFVIRLKDGSINFAGTVVDAPASPEVKLAGNLSAMPLETLKQMWPKFFAGGAREWVGERMAAGRITGGSFEVDLKPGELARIREGGDIPEASVLLDLAATGLEIYYIPEMPPLHTREATLKIRGRRMALDADEGWINLPSGRKVTLSDGSLEVDDLRPNPEIGRIEFNARGAAQSVLELLDHRPLGYARETGIKPQDLGGETTGRFTLEFPLIKDLEFEHVKLRGKVNLENANAKGTLGGGNVEGGDITFNINEQAIEASGDVLVNGVPAVLKWQRIFDAPPGKQPDLRLSAVLDEAERSRIGLDINDVLKGPVPTIVSIEQAQAPDQPRKVRVQADLGNAEITLANMGWHKARGRAAVLGFDVGQGIEGNTELQNFRLFGDDIAIEGWVSLDGNHKPKAFYFPDFSFNVITHLEVEGKLRPKDNIWEVHANGPAFDGRQFFRSLFTSAELGQDTPAAANDDPGLDFKARIGAVVGFSDTTLKDVTVDLAKRRGRLVSLEGRGRLNGKSELAVKLVDGVQDERVVLAESDNAGAAFRLIGFYPRMEGGQASLKVTLDARGPATTTGTLWARDFNVLGDKVVQEVLSNASDDPTVAFGQRRDGDSVARRQRIRFDQLEVPFSVGQGQFVLHDSFINGPQLGATLRGNVDFRTKYVDLGGTFIPLYGLNSALGSIPLIGNLLVGRRGEGVLGVTYAVKGAAEDPRVLVNPMSVVAPGIFRQIFEFTGRMPETFPDPSAQGTQPVPSISPMDRNRYGPSN